MSSKNSFFAVKANRKSQNINQSTKSNHKSPRKRQRALHEVEVKYTPRVSVYRTIGAKTVTSRKKRTDFLNFIFISHKSSRFQISNPTKHNNMTTQKNKSRNRGLINLIWNDERTAKDNCE